MDMEAHLVTGGIGSLAGGLGYLGSLALTRDPQQAAQADAAIGNALTYAPRTALGKKWSGEIQNDIGYLGQKGGNIAGGAVTDASARMGLPPAIAGGLGAAANTLYNVPQFLLGADTGAETDVAPPESAIPGAEHGLVVPPSTTNPTLFNRLLEGFGGKLATAQHASIKNQPIIDSVVRNEFNLPEGTPLTPDTMERVRAEAAAPYKAVAAIPEITFGPEYEAELNKLGGQSAKISRALPNFKAAGADQVNQLLQSLRPENGVMDGETAVELSKTLRSEGSAHWAAANRTGDPVERSLGKAYSGAAAAVENAVEAHLKSIGQDELASEWDNARRTIAKTYSVQSALDGAGHVDARNLGKQLIKGKPLSGNLATLADFANAYPKAANVAWSKESVPGISPLDVAFGSTMGFGTGLATHEPLAGVAAGSIPLGRMAVRSGLLSKPGQYLGIPGVSPMVPTIGNLARFGIAGLPSESNEDAK
jgi:hypothetical protein